MELRKIQVRSHKEAFGRIKRALDGRVVDLDKKHYVIVPDDCTLMAEKLLFGGGGAFDIEVLTFNRLFNKLAAVERYLPRQGAVMLLKSVIGPLEKELKFFKRSVAYKGFAQKLYDTIGLLAASGAAPEDLEAGSAQIGRLGDIKLIYKNYLEASEGRFIDAAGRMELLRRKVGKTDFSGVSFYFAGFSNLTVQQRNIIGELERTALCLTLFEAGEPQMQLGEVELYCAQDDAEQLKTAAKRIRTLVKNGAAYSDIAIISPSVAFEKAKRILSEFDIPFFIDQKSILSEHSLARYFYSIRRILENGYKAFDFITLSKNPFSGVDKNDADEFENYCLKYCIDYKRFTDPFTLADGNAGGANRLAAAERVRQQLMRLAADFDFSRRRVRTAQDFYIFIAKTADAAASGSAVADAAAVAEKICSVAELLTRVYQESETDFNVLFDMFCEGLQANAYSVIPKRGDVVVIGGCSSFRAEKFAHMFVIDFCEGVIPPHKDDAELISDGDIDTLLSLGVTLEPKISEQNRMSVNDFLFSVTETESVFLAYSEGGAKRKSELYPLFLNARKLSETSFEAENDLYYGARTHKAEPEKIAADCSTKSNALEMLLVSAAKAAAGEKTLSFAAEINALFDEREYAKFISGRAVAHTFLPGGNSLFFKNKRTSVTQIQEYFLCPYSAFLKYSLRLSEREDGRLSALDIGSFLHRAAEIFIARNDFSAPAETMRSIAGELAVADEKYLLDPNYAVIQRLVGEAVAVAPVLARQISGGKFVPRYQEKRFPDGGNEPMKTVSLKTREGLIEVSGAIDRVDLYGKYARVIDYKSGNPSKTDFDFSELYAGRKLQLPLYLAVLKENGFIPAGGFYFPLAAAWDDDEYSHRLKGLYEKNADVLTAMDLSLAEPGAKSAIINARRKSAQKGELCENDFYACAYALESGGMDAVCAYALDVMTGAAEELSGGYIAPSPYENACGYCAYTAVCGMNGIAPCRVKKTVKSETIIGITEARR